MSESREKETEKYVAREFRKSFSLGIFFLVVTLILPILNQFAGGFMFKKTPPTSWGGSSAGRASRSQCEGREFDPPPLHQYYLLSFKHLAN